MHVADRMEALKARQYLLRGGWFHFFSRMLELESVIGHELNSMN